MKNHMTKTVRFGLLGLLLPALLPASAIISVDFTHFTREFHSDGSVVFNADAVQNNVGSGGAADTRNLTAPILGFNLPSFGSSAVIESGTFAVELTRIFQHGGRTADLYMFNPGVNPSALDPEAAHWSGPGIDERGDVTLLAESFATSGTALGMVTADLTGLQLQGFYDASGDPTQSTIWFRMNLDANVLPDIRRYEFDVAGAELTIIPEPRVYAALFGVFALAWVLYRRRLK